MAWEELHTSNERNARKAAKCDKLIAQIKHKTDSQWSQIMTIQNLLSSPQTLPTVRKEVEAAMETLAGMEALFSDVEISLLALEDTIEAREMQEKQLEQRFQMAIYQEKRRAEFNELSNQMQLKLDRKRRELEDMEHKEQQEIYQKLFEKDMSAHKAIHSAAAGRRDPSSSLSNNFLRPPPTSFDPDASLETVDLNDDLAADDGNLEKFLNEDDEEHDERAHRIHHEQALLNNDLLYDVSPLPKDDDDEEGADETTSKDEEPDEATSSVSVLTLTPKNEQPPITTTPAATTKPPVPTILQPTTNTEQLQQQVVTSPAAMEQQQIMTMTSSASNAESIYFTPDSSANEKLSEL